MPEKRNLFCGYVIFFFFDLQYLTSAFFTRTSSHYNITVFQGLKWVVGSQNPPLVYSRVLASRDRDQGKARLNPLFQFLELSPSQTLTKGPTLLQWWVGRMSLLSDTSLSVRRVQTLNFKAMESKRSSKLEMTKEIFSTSHCFLDKSLTAHQT